jgi:hypothetical protein
VSRLVPAALAAAGFVAGLFPVFDGDLFWHLASGRWIVEHGAVPRVDPFRFSAEGLPWVDHEWLFQLVVYAVERVVGLDGLIVLRAAALAGFALLVYAVSRRGGVGPGLAGLLALGATLGVRPRFLDRPEIFTLFFVVLLLSVLERREIGRAERLGGTRAERLQRRGDDSGVVPEAEIVEGGRGTVADGRDALRDGVRPGSTRFGESGREVAALVLLVVAWVNFHGEALLAPVLAGLFLVGAAIGGRAAGRGSGWERWPELVGVPALLALALLANPYGWKLIEVPLGIRAALADLAAVNPEWLPAWRAPQPYLFAGLAATAALAGLARRRIGRWPAPEWGLPAFALAVLALSAVRHQALVYAAAAPFAARCLATLPEVAGLEARRGRRLGLAAAAAALLAAAWTAFPPANGPLAPRHGGLRLGVGLAAGRFPTRLVGKLAAHPGVGPLYNEFPHGGYLLWRLHPPRRVFWDGRMELEPGLLHELAAARRSPADWHALLSSRGAVGALVRYEPRPVPLVEPDGRGGLRRVGATTANSHLFPRQLWRLADWDDEAMLFLAAGAGGWPGEPYHAVDPEDVDGTLRRAASDETYRRAALAEVERKLGEEPDCRRAAQLAAALRGAAP